MLKVISNLFKKWGEALSPTKEEIEVKSEQIFIQACKECPRLKQEGKVVTEETKEVETPVEETEEETYKEPNVTAYPLIYFERKQDYPTKFSLYEILEDNQSGEITVVFERDNSKPATKTRSGNYSLANDQGKVVTVRRHTILKIVETYKNTAGHEYYRKPN